MAGFQLEMDMRIGARSSQVTQVDDDGFSGAGGILGSVAAHATSGTWTYDYTGTTRPEGSHAFVARGLDANGYSDHSADFLVHVDLTAPTVSPSARKRCA